MFNRLMIFMLPIILLVFLYIHLFWFDPSLTATASLVMLILLGFISGINTGIRIMADDRIYNG